MIVNENLPIAKELKDVVVLLKDLVKTIKTKGDYTTLLGEFVTAVSGIDQLDDEFKENIDVCFATMGYELMQIPAILLKKVEAAPAV